MHYRAYGLTLSSTVTLPDLTLVDAGPAALAIGEGPPISDRSRWRWIPRHQDQEWTPWLAVGVNDTEYVLSFEDGVDFTVSTDGRTIVSRPHEGAAESTVQHLLIDQVIPLVLGHTGRLVLHAGAFAIDDSAAIAVVGDAGSGKSTLTASVARAGGVIVADDAVLIETCGAAAMATPSYPGLRVWPDMVATAAAIDTSRAVAPYTSKRRFGADAAGLKFADAPVRLKRVYVLDRPRDESCDVTIAPLSRRDAVLAVIKHTFLLDVADPARAAAHLDRVVNLSQVVAIKRLVYPRTVAALTDVHRAVAEDLHAS
jgi:hypothetical protein